MKTKILTIKSPQQLHVFQNMSVEVKLTLGESHVCFWKFSQNDLPDLLRQDVVPQTQ